MINIQEDMTQKSLMAEFANVTETIRDTAAYCPTSLEYKQKLIATLKEVSDAMLATYERVEKMHAEVRIAEAESAARVAESKQHRSPKSLHLPKEK